MLFNHSNDLLEIILIIYLLKDLLFAHEITYSKQLTKESGYASTKKSPRILCLTALPSCELPFSAPTSPILSHFIIFIKRKETTYKINLSKGLHYN